MLRRYAEEDHLSADENKTLHHRLLAAMNRDDLEAASALLAPDAINHNPVPGEPPGIAGLRYRLAMLHTAFPDLRFVTEAIIAEGDTVATRGVLTGTHTGPFAGMPATGKAVRVSYIDMIRIVDGKLVEHWVQLDQLGMMQQLGAIPAPGAQGA